MFLATWTAPTLVTLGGAQLHRGDALPQRRLSDQFYKIMLDDFARSERVEPGGQRASFSDSSATGSHPTPALRTSHFPDPPSTTLEPPLPAAS